MDETRQNGELVIISGPSGVGKTSVLKQLFGQCELPLVESVSATTRPKRPGETEGVSYYYLTQKEFDQKKEQGEFLEFCEVFGRGYWYGTLNAPVRRSLDSGNWMVLEIDVEGAQKVLNHYPDAITIFIHPGSEEELERRLRGRKTETEDSLTRRLEVARKELEASSNYQHIVINESVEQTATDICQLLKQAEKN
ncbi:MAG: guanylate kinase [Planctomycetota bacterium]